LDDDGLSVEPEFYVPILPLALVNGGEGIGTGWSTLVPNFNPRDIVDNIKRLLRSEGAKEMIPWYRSFEVRIGYSPPGREGGGRGS
jgi:DNA topoisomerase-2